MAMTFGVYIHARPNGEAFYVGKGKRSRAYNLNQRNKHHANIVAKYDKENIIIDFVPCESNEIALVLEIEWIKTLLIFGANLTNQTDGGEGSTGYKHTTESLKKLSDDAKKQWRKDNRLRMILQVRNKGNQYGKRKKMTETERELLLARNKGNQYGKGGKHLCGRVWVNDGQTNHLAKPEDALMLFSHGWKRGRK